MGRRKQQSNLLPARPGLFPERIDGPQNRLGLHDHARPAAVGDVIGHFVAIRREVAQVPNLHIQKPFLLSALEDAMA
jgi:hypothetical protein